MSIAADRRPQVDLPGAWARLERGVEETALSLAYWRRRAGEAETEVKRLRTSLEELAAARASGGGVEDGAGEEVRRLRAENAALRSRIQQAHTRVGMLLKRLVALGIEP